jgi:hypothetical protein
VALEYFILKAYDLLDDTEIIKVLPMIALYEHIVIDIMKKV